MMDHRLWPARSSAARAPDSRHVSARRNGLGRVDEERYKALERWQIEIDDYRTRLMEIAQASPSYAGGEIRHETRELIIFGVGRPAKALAAIMEQAPSSVHVTWREAPYSLAELTAEMRRIMSGHRGQLHQGGARYDGTGIDFTTTARRLLEADDPQAALGTRYPVSIEYGEPATYG
jgi:hypothetical protein